MATTYSSGAYDDQKVVRPSIGTGTIDEKARRSLSRQRPIFTTRVRMIIPAHQVCFVAVFRPSDNNRLALSASAPLAAGIFALVLEAK